MDAYEEIMANEKGYFEEDVDDWAMEEGWMSKEKWKKEHCIGFKEQMSLSTKTVKILADIRNK